MATVELIQDEAGQIFAKLPGGSLRPVTENQAQQIHENPGALSNILGAAAEGVGVLAAGAGQLAGIPGAREMRQELGQNLEARSMVSPVSTMAGQAAPLVAAGIATAGASVPLQAAGWGAVGAAMDPDDPLAGALIGAGLAAVPGAAGALIRSDGAQAIVSKARGLRNVVPGIRQTPEAQVAALQAADQVAAAAPAGGIPRAAAAAPEAPGTPLGAIAGAEPAPPGPLGLVERPELIGPPPRPASPLASVTGAEPPAAAPPPAAVAPAAGGRPRVLEGFMQPDELEALGMKLTPGDARALLATTDDELAAARTLRDAEEKARAGITGGPVERIRNEQATGFDKFVKRELGIPEADAAALTDTRLGRFFRGINQRFETAMGTIEDAAPASIERFRGTLDNVVSNASSESARVVERFAADFARETRNGTLNRQALQTLDRTLNNGIKAAQRQGLADKVSDLTTLRSGIMGIVEESAPAGIRQELQNLRRQYALGATLLRPGARDTAGRMNPQTVRNAWNLNRAYPKTNIGATRISRMLETAAFLNQRLTPTSGTAERLLSAIRGPVTTAVTGIPGL